MGTDTSPSADDLRLFHTGEHPCGYWPGLVARDLVLDPRDPRLAAFYPTALSWGFRRSGDLVYRPHCEGCRACVAVRIPASIFKPDRSQRRCAARNADLRAVVMPARATDEYFVLYERYLDARHGDGPMAQPTPEEFENFLIGTWSRTLFLELREGDRLLAVAVTDALPQGLSAVYTFYEPGLPQRSLGTFAILQQIALAARRQLPFVYLGYWLPGHPKMDYKRRFGAMEILRDGKWQALR